VVRTRRQLRRVRESCREDRPGASRPGGPGGLVWAVKNPGFDTGVNSTSLLRSRNVVHSSAVLLLPFLIHSMSLVLSPKIIHSSGIGTLSYTNSFCSVVTVHF